MRGYHLTCEWDFDGANLCTNSGVYLSREKAIEVFNKGFSFQDWVGYKSYDCLESRGMAFIEEIEIE